MPELLVDKQGHVTVLTLNRPEKMNAYDGALVHQMEEAYQTFENDPDQYVLVVTGAGDRAFCTGSDFSSQKMEGRPRTDKMKSTDMWGVGSLSKPTIAAVNGAAIGGGLEIVLNCDIRIASENAYFGLFEPKRGIMAGVGVHLLPRNISWGDASLLLLACERVDAHEAHRMGLVQKVVRPGGALEEAMRLAEQICKLSQVAVQSTKKVMSLHRNNLLDEGLNLSSMVHRMMYLSGDNVEGPKAFLEKREPNFRNRWADAQD
ncbi:MAG: enoyl-CoA hydratase/isomerase family protein [Acidimicrobiia bacterium]